MSDLLRYREPFRFAWLLSQPFKFFAFMAMCSALCAKSLFAVRHYLTKQLTDSLQIFKDTQVDVGDIWYWFVVFVICQAFINIFWRLSGFMGMRWLTGVEEASYKMLFSYLTGHSKDYFSKKFAGSLTSKVTNASGGLVDLLATCLWQFMVFLVGLLSSFYIAYIASPLLFLSMFAWVIIFIAINYCFVKNTYKHNYVYAESGSDLKGKIVDTASNISEVHHGGNTRYEEEYVGSYIYKFRKSHLKAWSAVELSLMVNGVLNVLFTIIMIGGSIYLFLENTFTLGTVLMIVVMVRAVQQDIFQIGLNAAQSAKHYSQIKEGLDEILVPHGIPDKNEAIDFEINEGSIHFKDVSFSYGKKNVFNDFSIKIPSGQKLGIVGVSGAGKSTFVSLLLRQYDINDGSITIGGKDIRDFKQSSLRRKIALVPQDTSLFHRSISDNIRYGNLAASEEQLQRAAKLALADDFIVDLEEGYNTYVGERGVKLSGGQRQRVAIARALLKDAPILVLDEATSALDSESEAAVQQALVELFDNRTVIAIAHRLSTLLGMERIVVIDSGKIIEDGSHEKLIQKKGIYSQLWEAQVSGFIKA